LLVVDQNIRCRRSAMTQTIQVSMSRFSPARFVLGWKMRHSYLAKPIALILFLAILFSSHGSRAQVTQEHCGDPCEATILFSYSGNSVFGIVPGSALGSGRFTIPVGTGSPDSPGLTDVSKFTFSQTTTGTSAVGPSTFSYGPGSLTSFSLNFSSAPSVSAALNLNTNFVSGSDSNFLPESFSVSSGTGQTSRTPGPVLLTSGAITLNQKSVIAAIVHGAVSVTATGPLSIFGQDTAISANFVPNFNLTLAQAAALGGFTGFTWVQTVTADPTRIGLAQAGVTPPFNDPPGSPAGTSVCGLLGAICEFNPSSMSMADQPKNSCFGGAIGLLCGGTPIVEPFQVTKFETDLVGLLPNGQEETLVGFDWDSNYSGLIGDTWVYGSSSFDDGGGVGGITLLSETYPLEEGFQTPLPAALPLFATGLGALGLLGWRRKRKGAAVAA
jgi:hypothetical protein